ncbi:WD repeat-containing protein 37, partial [Tulasnella sp. 419]
MADLTEQPNQHDIAATTLSLIKHNLARISHRMLKIAIGGLVEVIELLLEEATNSEDDLQILSTQMEEFSDAVACIIRSQDIPYDSLENFSIQIGSSIESCNHILLSRTSSGLTAHAIGDLLTPIVEGIYRAVSDLGLPGFFCSPKPNFFPSPAGAEWPNDISHAGCVSSIAIPFNGQTIATASWDNTACLWDAWTGKQIVGLGPHSEEVSVVFTTGSHVISGTFDGCICVWEKESVPGGKPSWKRIAVLRGHSDSISSIASSGRWKLVSGSWDNTVRVWSYDGRLLATLQGHEGVISSVAASKYGAFIISGSSDQTIRVWDAYNYSLLTSLALNNAQTITSLSFCWDGSIISVHENDQIQQWSLLTMQMKMEQRGKLGSLRQLSVSRDFSVAVSIGQNCRYLQIWNLSIGISEVASTCLVKLEDLEPSISSECTAVAISEDGTYAVLGYSDGKIAKVSMETAMSRVDRTRTIEEVPSSSSDDSTLAILRGPLQLLSQLEETAYDVKYCVQQVLRSLRDTRSLITQLDFLFRNIHTSPSQGDSDQALKLADDVVQLG